MILNSVGIGVQVSVMKRTSNKRESESLVQALNYSYLCSRAKKWNPESNDSYINTKSTSCYPVEVAIVPNTNAWVI